MIDTKQSGINFPKLLYIGDVPIESSYHGSALFYRLLQNYPTERLRIIEGGGVVSLPERRLRFVDYNHLRYIDQRCLNTRFHKLISTWYMVTAQRCASQISKLLNGFSPQAVLTVAHGYSWMAAAAYAHNENLPLHLIVHDDWPRVAQIIGLANKWLDRKFGDVYRQATTRMCVSPFMREEYEHRYGAIGSVLYPSRAENGIKFSTIPSRIDDSKEKLVYAFGGTINTPGHVQALTELANVLQRFGAKLNIYGPLTEADARKAGLSLPNVTLCGLLSSNEYIQELREKVDVLFLPMSFSVNDRANMSLCFPSKLTDYTTTGLPLLIYGPEYSSAVRWARENTGVAEVVAEEGEKALSRSVDRFNDSQYRNDLGDAALRVGNRYFGHESVKNIFYDHLLRSNTCKNF